MSNELTQTALPLSDRPTESDAAQRDMHLIEIWLHGRSPETQRAYRTDTNAFLTFVGKCLATVTLHDVQRYSDALDACLEAASKHRRLASLKSLFAFGCKLGYLPFDTTRPLRLPVIRDRLSERILSEAEMQTMLAQERHPRNRAMLYLLYATGVRVSECCSLQWRSVVARTNGIGQITVLGKGGKTNTILLPASVWRLLDDLRGPSQPDAPVFRSRNGKHLHPTHIRRIVRAAGKRAGIDKPVSPHWFRHASASHALDRGAPIHLVQATLNHSSIATTGKYLHARPTESSASFLPL